MVEQAVLVDLDGTIWDSLPWCEQLIAAVGSSAPESLPMARRLRSAGYTKASFATVCASGQPPLTVYKAALESLTQLSEAGFVLGAVTNLPGWMARPMMGSTGVGELVTAVVDYGTTRKHKPNPEPLLTACKLLKVNPADTWYVGDDPNDALAAKAAGMPFAWASWGYFPAPPDHANKILTSPKDLGTLAGAR